MTHVIGLDLGGTTLSSAVVDLQGNIVSKHSSKLKSREVDYVVNTLINDAKLVAKKANISMETILAVGIGCPGLIDTEHGIVLKAANFPDWVNVALGPLVSKGTGCSTFVENDGNCAAAAEGWVGAGKSVKRFVMLTLGTGIGGGAILNGVILKGLYEPGHLIAVLDGRLCPCGQKGCVERYCSAKAVERQAKILLEAGEESSLQGLVDGNDYNKVDSREIWNAAKKGDPLAQKVTNEAARYLALTCINTSRTLDPGRIAFSGGMALTGEYLFNLVNKYYDELDWTIGAPRPEIVPAQVGNSSGMIGAAYIAKLSVPKKRAAL